MLGEVMTTLGKISWLVDSELGNQTSTVCPFTKPSKSVPGGEDVLSPETRAASLTTLHKSCRVEYAPLGVLGVIAPVSASGWGRSAVRRE